MKRYSAPWLEMVRVDTMDIMTGSGVELGPDFTDPGDFDGGDPDTGISPW